VPLSDTIKSLIRNAWDDGAPCLVATCGPAGPNISVKGSMIVFDDAHLAYWERSKRTALENLSYDKRVCVMYLNFKAQREGVLGKRLLALLRQRRTTRQQAHARGDFCQTVAARADPCRRRYRHWRADQDRQSDRYPRQAGYVIRWAREATAYPEAKPVRQRQKVRTGRRHESRASDRGAHFVELRLSSSYPHLA
jgi:Pyridoxamine 5'-phosphate oxidase